MLSIDEAIEKYKEITNSDTICLAHCDKFCDECVQESEQLVEWLEELKKLRQCTNIENREYPYFNGFKEGKQVGYNKAIDDFKKEIIDMVNNSPTVENDYGEIRPMNIEEICEIIVDKLTSTRR